METLIEELDKAAESPFGQAMFRSLIRKAVNGLRVSAKRITTLEQEMVELQQQAIAANSAAVRLENNMWEEAAKICDELSRAGTGQPSIRYANGIREGARRCAAALRRKTR